MTNMALILFLLIFETVIENCDSISVSNDSSETWNRKSSPSMLYHSATEKIFLNLAGFETNNTHFLNISLDANLTLNKTSNVSNAKLPWTPDDPPKELPFAIIVAGPTAAFFVIIFLCVAFYFHNVQLNKKAQKMSYTMYVSPDLSSGLNTDDTATPNLLLIHSNESSSASNLRVHRDSSAQNTRMSRDGSALSIRLSRDSDIAIPQRKSTVSLGLPSRGSTLSAFSDQEVVHQSSKRKHSIFIL